MAMATWSRQHVLDFIEKYQSLECLWKIKSKDYSNRALKDKAYSQLIDFVKDFDPLANRDSITRKINTLRTTFRKELRKVENSMVSGTEEDIYTPKLWYFDHMIFLRNQETPRIAVSNLQWQFGEECDSKSGILDTTETPPQDDNYTDRDLVGMEATQLPESSSLVSPTPMHPANFTSAWRRKSGKRSAEEDILTLQLRNQLSWHCEDEHDAYAKSVAIKMKKLTREQQYFAERLITDVLYEAASENLSKLSYVVTT